MAIVKSLSRKSGTGQLFGYILRYMLNEEKGIDVSQDEVDRKMARLVIRHNVRSRTPKGYAREFDRMESMRIYKRKNNVKVYHEIISFSNKDKEHINEALLKDMAKKYIELRGKDNLYVITPHFDKDHIHLHCATSGVKLNGLSSRISRAEFSQIKIALDGYQKEKYPQLAHSLPRHGRAKSEELKKETVEKIKNRTTSDKQTILGLLRTVFDKSTSREQFYAELQSLGHVPYYRLGKLTGLKYDGNRKFRLGRLGYDEKRLLELDAREQEEKALLEIQNIRDGKNTRITYRKQALPLEERIKCMDEVQQQKELQQEVNRNRAFEEKQMAIAPVLKDDMQLQEIIAIREGRNTDTDRSRDAEDAHDRDRSGENERENERDDTSDGREDESDKDAERAPDDADDSDDEPASVA